jgi:hypothetical protein
MVIEGKIILPIGGELKVKCEVRHYYLTSEYHVFGCVIIEASSSFGQKLAELLLSNTQRPTISELLIEGFEVRNTEKALKFRYAEQRNFYEILQLRRDVAHFQGRFLDVHDSLAFSDDLDLKSRHLLCEIGGRVIGAVRIIFNDGKPEFTEMNRYHISIPEFIWKKGFIEASFLNVDPMFQITDIYLNLLRQVARISIQNEEELILLSCCDDEMEYLKPIGCEELGIQYYIDLMEGRPLNLMYIDAKQILKGRSLKMLNWANFFKPLTDFLVDGDQFKLLLYDKLRIRTYQYLISPIKVARSFINSILNYFKN